MIGGINQGIVLRTYIPQKHKLAVFDSELGRIECIPQNLKNSYRLSHGVLIEYSLQQLQISYKLFDANILNLPKQWSKNSFYFFHHILELCYYFLPIESEAKDIFQLIKILYTDSDIVQSDISKKIFLCHFFIKLGIYPENMLAYDASFHRLISGPLDSKIEVKDEKNIHFYLQRWLLECINSHPYAHRLKTINYLKNLYNYE